MKLTDGGKTVQILLGSHQLPLGPKFRVFVCGGSNSSWSGRGECWSMQTGLWCLLLVLQHLWGDACFAISAAVLPVKSSLLGLNQMVTSTYILFCETVASQLQGNRGRRRPVSGHFRPKHFTWAAENHILGPQCCGFQIDLHQRLTWNLLLLFPKLNFFGMKICV